MKRIFIILSFILFAFNQNTSAANVTALEHISAMLFPETSSWTPVSKMKHAQKELINSIESQLRSAYSISGIYQKQENSDCSFINRLFSGEYNSAGNIFLNDIDCDGLNDVIYTGPALCSEGNATLIWFGKTDHSYEIRQAVLWHALTLRIKEGANVLISSVSTGCCGELIDEYMCGSLRNFRSFGLKKFFSNTELPLSMTENKVFVTEKEIALRSSPFIIDEYNENLSGLVQNAVFGNVLSRYMPACKGRIAAIKTDKNNRVWYFVILEQDSKILRTHTPFDICAGWIDSMAARFNE